MSKIDYSRNYYNLKYSDKYRSFSFTSKKVKDAFRLALNKEIFENAGTKILCNEKSFSSSSGESAAFCLSEFYELMLENLDKKNSGELIRNLNHFVKLDINWDEYYSDRVLRNLMKNNPNEYVDKDTSVCYIYKPEYRDETYRYDLYVKLSILPSGNVRVMSLHWGGDREDISKDKMPMRVWNTKTNSYDPFSKCLEYLRDKREERERLEEMNEFEKQYGVQKELPEHEDYETYHR